MNLKKDFYNKEMSNGWLLTNKQIDFLSRYPLFYNAWAGSYLEILFLQRFWTKLACYIPQFVAPSSLTFLGLFINFLGCLFAFYYSPDFKNDDMPASLSIILALSTFLYQTLDALDGKQSYKVQNTAIEELSDHGCDAMSSVFMALSISTILQLGNRQFLLITFLMLSLTAFFFTHFVSHITHSMIFGRIDVSEAQFTCIVGYLFTAYFGQSIWMKPVFQTSTFIVSLGTLLIYSSMATLLYSIYKNIEMTFFGKQTPLEKIGIKIPRKAINWSTCNSIFAALILVFCCYLNYFYGLMNVNPLVFCFTFGLSYSKLIITLVMINVSRGDFELLDTSLIAPVMLSFNCLFYHLYGDFLVNSYTALLCSLIWTLIDCLRYFTYAMWDVKYALDANIFTIKFPVGHKKNKAGGKGFYVNGLNNKQVVEEWNTFVREENDLFKELFRTY